MHASHQQTNVVRFSTADGAPGNSVADMAESWKVEQTCTTVPSPVIDPTAPCSKHEARKQWAEKECHAVSRIIAFC